MWKLPKLCPLRNQDVIITESRTWNGRSVNICCLVDLVEVYVCCQMERGAEIIARWSSSMAVTRYHWAEHIHSVQYPIITPISLVSVCMCQCLCLWTYSMFIFPAGWTRQTQKWDFSLQVLSFLFHFGSRQHLQNSSHTLAQPHARTQTHAQTHKDFKLGLVYSFWFLPYCTFLPNVLRATSHLEK